MVPYVIIISVDAQGVEKMAGQSPNYTVLSDKLSTTYSELRFMNIILRGILDIVDNEGAAAYAAIHASDNRRAEVVYDSMIATIFYLNERIARLIDSDSQ